MAKRPNRPLKRQSQMQLPMTEAEARKAHIERRSGPNHGEAQSRTPLHGEPRPPAKEQPPVTPPSKEIEERVGVSAHELAALYALESIRGFGPAKFREVYEAGLTFIDVLHEPQSLPSTGKRGDLFRRELTGLTNKMNIFEQRANKQISNAARLGGQIVTYWSKHYPRQVFSSNNAVPAIYLIGAAEVLADERTVACVGSRKIRAPYDGLHKQFARLAVESGFSVVSGFALGADTLGHRTAFEMGGKTICVMPSGLDRPFPPENRAFWKDLLSYPKAALVSEFPFGTSASALTLRKRNKLIVAFARGVLMSQSSDKGGAMNAYRFALELGRPFATFEPDDDSDTSGNRLAIAAPKGDVTAFPVNETDKARVWLQRLLPSI